MSLYFLIMLGTIAGPLLLSFDKKVHFYTNWRYIFSSTAIVAALYLIWDEVYTQIGVWGFNPDYLQGFYLGNLPFEEVCFFLFVPYAFLFIHECLIAYFPRFQPKIFSNYFAVGFTILCLVLGLIYLNNLYTAAASFVAVTLTLWFVFRKKVEWYPKFLMAYFVVQIPFFIVNGALTGMFTPEPIVWYNEAEIIGPRWVSIPLEDTIYNYGFLILVFYFYDFFKKRAGERV